MMMIPKQDGSGPNAAFMHASRLTVVIGLRSALKGIDTGSPRMGSASHLGGCDSAGWRFVCEYLRLILVESGILRVRVRDKRHLVKLV